MCVSVMEEWRGTLLNFYFGFLTSIKTEARGAVFLFSVPDVRVASLPCDVHAAGRSAWVWTGAGGQR